MSTYSILSTPVPTISYCIFHQAASSKLQEEYTGTIRDLHASLLRESGALSAAYQKSVREAIVRESQALRGALGEFLAMPVRSDNVAVQKIFTEGFERYHGHITGEMRFGVTMSWDGKLVDFRLQKAAEKKLELNGRTYLKGLGFAPSKQKGDIFESVFIVEGGMNLDFLEHIIRDRLGIYRTTHGRHLERTGAYTFAAYNLVRAWGPLPHRQSADGQLETVVYFSKPEIEYDRFRAGVNGALEKLAAAEGLAHLSLWQRKLGLGKGKEFILRCLCESQLQAGSVIAWLTRCSEPGFLKDVLITNGNLILKELLVL